MNILIKPIITEKARSRAEYFEGGTFVVKKKANEGVRREARGKAYVWEVTSVRAINVRPDRRVRYTKTGVQTGKTTAVKKAIVQVAEGDTIDFYANI